MAESRRWVSNIKISILFKFFVSIFQKLEEIIISNREQWQPLKIVRLQPLGDVLQNSCSSPLLKKQLNHTYEKLHRGIFYNRSRTTVLCLDFEFQTVEVICQGSWGPRCSKGPEFLGSRGSMGSWGTGGPGGLWGSGAPGGPRGPKILQGPKGPRSLGLGQQSGSADWVPLFYCALFPLLYHSQIHNLRPLL